MTQASKGNQQIIDAEEALIAAVAPQTDMEIIAHTQAMLTLALVREQRTANLIAYFAPNGAVPPASVENLILDALGLTKEDDK